MSDLKDSDLESAAGGFYVDVNNNMPINSNNTDSSNSNNNNQTNSNNVNKVVEGSINAGGNVSF